MKEHISDDRVILSTDCNAREGSGTLVNKSIWEIKLETFAIEHSPLGSH